MKASTAADSKRHRDFEGGAVAVDPSLSPPAAARKKTVQDSPSHGGAGSSVATATVAGGGPTPDSSDPPFPYLYYYTRLRSSPDFVAAIESLTGEPYDPVKLSAWAANVGRKAKAYKSGNIEEVWAFEEQEEEQMYGKLSDDDSYQYEDGDVDGEIEWDESSSDYFDSDSDEEEEGFLCAIICDFLCDLPNTPSQLWDRETTRKVLVECGKNHPVESRCSSDPPREDTFQIDLRGLYSQDAQKTLRTNLFRLSREPQPFLKYLDVIVGCSIHGIGEGKLRQTVIDLLKDYKTFKWTEASNDAIISINLEDSVGWMAFEFAEDDVAIDETNMVEKVEAKEKPELCTVICDFLHDLPTKQRPDRRIARKVLVGLESCYGDDCGVDEDATEVIDLRGLYVDKAEDVLIDLLHKLTFHFSPTKYLNVTVGCKVHGVGKRNLGQAVVGILMRDKTIKWKEYHSGAEIRIEIDKSKDYRDIGLNSVAAREVQAITV